MYQLKYYSNQKTIKKQFFLPGIAMFLILGIGYAYSGENEMEWKVTDGNITPSHPYIEFVINYGNDWRSNNCVAGDLVITVGGSQWSTNIFKYYGWYNMGQGTGT